MLETKYHTFNFLFRNSGRQLVAPTEPETYPFRTVQNQRTIDDNVIEDSMDNRQDPMNLRTVTEILFTYLYPAMFSQHMWSVNVGATRDPPETCRSKFPPKTQTNGISSPAFKYSLCLEIQLIWFFWQKPTAAASWRVSSFYIIDRPHDILLSNTRHSGYSFNLDCHSFG